MSDDRGAFADIDQYVATNLKHFREDKSISQDELANRMSERGFGFTQATIWKIEQGQRPVKISEVVALGDALGLMHWTYLTSEPEAGRHTVRVQSANRAAHRAYQALRSAATEFLHRQVDLALVVREAQDAGFTITAEKFAHWLDTHAERAVLEARIDWEHEDEILEQREDRINRAEAALRKAGYEPLRPEEFEEVGGEEPLSGDSQTSPGD